MSAKLYAVTGRSFSGRGQQALVYARFASGACTIKEVVASLEANPEFSTVQSAERIAAYYICVLKKSGHIAVIPSEAAPVKADCNAAIDELIAERNAEAGVESVQ